MLEFSIFLIVISLGGIIYGMFFWDNAFEDGEKEGDRK